jgi:hypothetical protein
MNTIEIDFDVFKALTLRRESEEVTYNDVLRDLLGLDKISKRDVKSDDITLSDGAWITKGVRFPNGTEFRANYKGQTYQGKVQNNHLVVDGKRFDSPSSAAVNITGNPVNGWIFWECRLPGKNSWQIIKSLRK